ncbi:MAG: hypothetical protein KAR35_00570 [Candidatus Heimdallarchaeota archaeon]|nr:hypothetical protein [Candidatus Heimdallarchaeota archaeon]MCK5047845.1 hypothetical protein [Candidatus Heimdallarchaeota archaeon]
MSQEQPKDEIKILPPLKEVTDFLVLAKDHRINIYDSTDKEFCNVEGCNLKAEYTVGIIIPKNWLDHSTKKQLVPALHYTCKEHRSYFVDQIQEVAPKTPSVSIFDVSDISQAELSKMLFAIVEDTDYFNEYFVMKD